MATGGTTVSVACTSLEAAIAFYTDDLGFRLDMIMPADDPRLAVVSGYGITVRLERVGQRIEAAGADAGGLVISRMSGGTAWATGRAGMLYRDLIPDRLGGQFIASHIRITDGGPVPDYVHFHKIRFQMIYCRRGWVRVVYEDQGAPFVMHEGDCVLQPPEIRHRVLEASAGLEVVEIGTPAEHETWRDHALDLPTSALRLERDYGGQRFVRHVVAGAVWQHDVDGVAFRDTGIGAATRGQASVRVLRAIPPAQPLMHDGEFLFLYVLAGGMTLRSDAHVEHRLAADDSCVVPAGKNFTLDADGDCEVLEVRLPGVRGV
jgi:quercetin dioxygenase-like cupin family protein